MDEQQIRSVGFTDENTTGYSQTELNTLNSELEERLLDLEEGSPEWFEAAKNFSDEVASWATPPEGFDCVVYADQHTARLLDGRYVSMPCDLAQEARPGIMTADTPDGGSIWYWPDEGRAAVMAGGNSVWYDCNGATLRDENGEEIPITLALSYGMPVGFEDGLFYLDRSQRDAYSQGERITAEEAMRRLREA